MLAFVCTASAYPVIHTRQSFFFFKKSHAKGYWRRVSEVEVAEVLMSNDQNRNVSKCYYWSTFTRHKYNTSGEKKDPDHKPAGESIADIRLCQPLSSILLHVKIYVNLTIDKGSDEIISNSCNVSCRSFNRKFCSVAMENVKVVSEILQLSLLTHSASGQVVVSVRYIRMIVLPNFFYNIERLLIEIKSPSVMVENSHSKQ